ncbi:MAG: efflux RND transporter periplasmic adaptor subunit [Verrucomicrobiota bacterium]
MKKLFGLFKWLVLLALIGGAIAGYQWYSQRPVSQVIDYKTVTITRGDIIQSITANGQISPVKSVTVGSQVSGIITDIQVDYNSRVTNGQVIAQIDPSTYRQVLTQSEADMASAMAELELAQLNYGRARGLFTNQLLAATEFDKALADLHQAQAAVKKAEAGINKTKVDLERTTIYAPIDGVVISRNVDVGQTVASSFNTPTLFTIANDLRLMRIEAMVSEADVGGVTEGQRVNFTVDAFPTRQFGGNVIQVRFAPITNQNVVNYISVVEVSNPDMKLRPGMTANATIVTAQRTNTLRLPNSALRFRPPTNAVVLVNTNVPAGTRTNSTATASTGSSRPEGLPTPPWGEGRPPSREDAQKWVETLTPEQREKYQQWRERRRAEGGGGRNSSANASDGPATRTVYLVEKDKKPGSDLTVLKPVIIKTGITDGTNTEVIEGLNENDMVAAGVNLPSAAGTVKTTGSSSPFGQPFGGFRPR